MTILNKQTFTLILALIGLSGYAQVQPESIPMAHSKIQFIQNDGQWHKNVRYKSPLGVGAVFLENNVFTYVQFDAEQINATHEHDDHDHNESFYETDLKINTHAWKTRFEGANDKPNLS